jgi:dUTP pyrophosphatase
MQQEILNIYEKFMHLKIYITSTDYDLWVKYSQYVEQHNSKLLHSNTMEFVDAGFDLFTPNDESMMYPNKVNKVDYEIICSARMITSKEQSYNTGFFMFPRSSISKTNLRLANNVGIIDAGYRGHLIGMFDVVYSSSTVKLNKFDRHLQICAPGLVPIYVEIVKSREDLGEKTERGEGGFGSTGI